MRLESVECCSFKHIQKSTSQFYFVRNQTLAFNMRNISFFLSTLKNQTRTIFGFCKVECCSFKSAFKQYSEIFKNIEKLTSQTFACLTLNGVHSSQPSNIFKNLFPKLLHFVRNQTLALQTEKHQLFFFTLPKSNPHNFWNLSG